uniref:Uncharacterized protein n=1 Tax=Setaria italica TaxID=4555 RepID=K3XU03_SETIT
MRQRPRSSERSSRSSQGGVGAAAAAGWSGMAEKLWSGDDVTDDEEPSSWTISLGNFIEQQAEQRFGLCWCFLWIYTTEMVWLRNI